MTSSVMTKSQSLSDWLSYLEHIHPQQIDMGLTRVRQVAERADLLSLPSFVITVGGTNGKGTTCAMLSSILNEAGYTTGVYASPHLLRYNERIKINGEEVSDEEICESLAYVESFRNETSLTFFEFGTLAAFALFKKKKPDVVLLEVGLGGRLDATNIIDADISVITSIDLDHCDWLGNTREDIAKEKAGILRTGKPAIIGEPDIPTTLIAAAEQISTDLYCVDRDFSYALSEANWLYQGKVRQIEQLPVPMLPLPNAATALAVIEHMPSSWIIPQQAIEKGLEKAALSGRFQQIMSSPTVIVDVAHNPHAAKYLAKKLQMISNKRIHAVVGMLKDKDIEHTLSAVRDYIDDWFLADLQGPRAATAEMLSSVLPESDIKHTFKNVHQAYKAALKQASESDVIIVFGSFLTIADVLNVA